MRATLTFASLLIVLAIVAVTVRSQMQATRRAAAAAAAAASDAASVTLSGTPQNQVQQYKDALDAAMKADAQHTADQAASAGEDGSR